MCNGFNIKSQHHSDTLFVSNCNRPILRWFQPTAQHLPSNVAVMRSFSFPETSRSAKKSR